MTPLDIYRSARVVQQNRTDAEARLFVATRIADMAHDPAGQDVWRAIGRALEHLIATGPGPGSLH